MAIKNVLQAVHDALDEELARDDKVIILGQDVGLRGGVFRVTEGLIQRYGEARVMDAPLSESATRMLHDDAHAQRVSVRSICRERVGARSASAWRAPAFPA